MTAPTTGRFVWHELHTTDRKAAIAFYSKLMGWQIKEEPMGPGEPYALLVRDGKDFGGIMKSMAPANVPPHWLAYIAVEDVDASAAKVKELGGKVLNPPMDIPQAGRFSVVADPQGGAFALYKHDKETHPEEHAIPPLGSFCWNELATSDPKAAAKFYTALFGYTVDEKDMGPMGTYRLLMRGDRQAGGIMGLPPGVPHTHWLAYLAVKDVDQATRNAKELGATVHMQPMDIPEIGRFSVIADPTGAAIALFTGKPSSH